MKESIKKMMLLCKTRLARKAAKRKTTELDCGVSVPMDPSLMSSDPSMDLPICGCDAGDGMGERADTAFSPSSPGDCCPQEEQLAKQDDAVLQEILSELHAMREAFSHMSQTLLPDATRQKSDSAESCDEGDATQEKRADEVECPCALSNHPWFKLVEDVVHLDEEVELIASGSRSAEVQDVLEHVRLRLEEIVERNGVDLIKGETAFDILRHQPIPSTLISDGTPIRETQTAGWCVGERVLRRAKVSV